tara:strand:- start:242 stop:556 length:315 start_codon:yes stop_codon:yes gene_type:complete
MAKRKAKGLQFKKSMLENTYYTANPNIRNKTQFKDFTEQEKLALYNINPAEALRYFENPEAAKSTKKVYKNIPVKPTIDEEYKQDQTKQQTTEKTTERAENNPE